MTDSGISSIDRVFDLVDKTVDQVDRVLNRVKCTEEQHQKRRAVPKVIDVDTAPAVKADKPTPTSPSTATAIATQRFHIVESTVPGSGLTIFVVTNGGKSRAECTTRELAEKLLRALEGTP